MNAQRWFQRKEDYAPRRSPADSPFRRFDVKCLACGSYRLRLVAQMDEEAGKMAVVLVCTKCRRREMIENIWGREALGARREAKPMQETLFD